MLYNFGDWVVYDPGYKQEIGRVTECRADSAFVCYTKGRTAASTPLMHLRLATEEEIKAAGAGIGFHRFDEVCSKRVDEVCGNCKAVKV